MVQLGPGVGYQDKDVPIHLARPSIDSWSYTPDAFGKRAERVRMVITIKEYTIGAGNRDRTIVCFVGYKHCESLWLAEQEAMVQAADEATEAVRPSLRGASGQRPQDRSAYRRKRNPRGGFLFSLHRQLYAWTHKRTESDVKWIFWIIGPFNLSMKKAHFRCYLLTWLVLERREPSLLLLFSLTGQQ